jgi:hypothetical protein
MRVLAYCVLSAALLALCCAVGASAQGSRNYNVQTMNFDLWCQEQARLPPERCDKRLPDDDKAFNEYRIKIERYEIPYLQQKNNEASFDRNILHNDPVDRPLSQNPAAQQQDPNQPPLRAPP